MRLNSTTNTFEHTQYSVECQSIVSAVNSKRSKNLIIKTPTNFHWQGPAPASTPRERYLPETENYFISIIFLVCTKSPACKRYKYNPLAKLFASKFIVYTP
jgi:hypothetical protein